MRTKKALYNMSTSMLAQIVSIICGLITPRLILSAFGSTYNGVINSAAQFLSIVSILRLGIAGATRVALYKTLAGEDTLGTSRIMKATKQYMRKISGIIVVYTVLLMFVYPLVSHNDLDKIDCALIIGIVSISTFAEYFFGISNITLLSADQSEYVTSILNIVSLICNTIITAILIRLGCSIFAVKLGSSLVFLLSPAVLNYYVKRKYHLITDCEPDNSAIKQRGAVAFHSIANIIHSNTDILILTFFADAKLISVYTVYNMVTGKIKSLVQVFTSGMEAAFGNMWAKNEKETLKIVFSAFETGIYTLTGILFSCVGILLLSFIRIYTDGVTDIEYVRPGLAILITVTEAVFCIRQPYLLLVQATGSYEETKRGAMVEAIINLTTSIVLVSFLGVNGVIVGTLIANTFRTLQYALYISRRILSRPFYEVIKRIIILIADAICICSVSYFASKLIVYPTGWGSWLVCAFIVFIIASVISILFMIIFYNKDSKYIINKFHGFVLKRG